MKMYKPRAYKWHLLTVFKIEPQEEGGGGGEGGTYFASLAKGLGVFAQLKLGDSIKYRARCKFLFKEAK